MCTKQSFQYCYKDIIKQVFEVLRVIFPFKIITVLTDFSFHNGLVTEMISVFVYKFIINIHCSVIIFHGL